MRIKRRLLVMGLMLLAASLACGAFEITGEGLVEAELTLNANSVSTEQALATARVEATATRAYFETQEALCVNLTREECASLGGHSYNVLAVGRDTGKCNYSDWPYSEVWREITFENGKFILGGYTGEGYDGHTRIAENTYQWVNPNGQTIETVTFTMNGQTLVSDSGDCIWDRTYTFKE